MPENDQQPALPPPDRPGQRLAFREVLRRCWQTARNWSGADPAERNRLASIVVALGYMLALTVAFVLSFAVGWKWLLYVVAAPVFALVAARMVYDACKGLRSWVR